MEFVESDDGPFRRPPALDDRIWRHPSELGPVEGPGAPVATVPKVVTQRTLWTVALVAAVGASTLSAGAVVALGGTRVRTGVTDQTRRAVASADAPPTTAVEPVVAIAERVRPAIVQVRVEKASERVSGSGVLFLGDGHVLTNAHVVADATSISVILASGREVTATLVGSDNDTDAAVVKAEGGPYPVADMGSAAALRVGQTAVAVGSPLALAGGPSVTVGVVSALHRSIRPKGAANNLFDMIQTDAPIAPGSSGGALVDSAGKVIGITTAVAAGDVGADGFGFATPIDLARSIADELIATGKATHTWMGIEGNDLDGATAHDLSVDGGAVVVSVKDDGPAKAAGLQARDVIVGMDGRPVISMGALVVALRQHRPGDVVPVDVMRDKQRMTRSITLAERPSGS